MKELQDVSAEISLHSVLEYRLMAVQECDTLKRGFNKLRSKYDASIAKVSAMNNELDACRDESTQLKAQVTALQNELKAQSDKLVVQVASAVSAAVSTSAASTRIVRIVVRHYRPAH